MRLVLPRPAATEAPPFHQGYLAEVDGENIGEQATSQLAELETLYAGLEEAAALARYAPGKWSIKEVLGHLTDAERIFSYRLLRIVRGDATPLPGFDENAYVPAGRFDDRPVASLLAEFRAVREGTVALMAGVPFSSWSGRGEVSGHPTSARALAYIIVGHTAHHLSVLRTRYGLSGSAADPFKRRLVREHG